MRAVTSLVGHEHALLRMARKRWRGFTKKDCALRHAYFSEATSPRLQIGCGDHPIEGWLNTDFAPSDGVMMLDATETFPFADDCFSFVYCEHMIEHIPFNAGARMLNECRRVLRPGGALRIVTPDIFRVLSVYVGSTCETGSLYAEYFKDELVPKGSPRTTTGLVNAMFREWGHQFLYDERTLTETLSAAGFVDPARKGLQESAWPEFRGLANSSRYPAGLLEFESLTIEARKPEG